MRIKGLGHVNVDSVDLDATERFYNFFGLVKVNRPLASPGIWMGFKDGPAIVHVNKVEVLPPPRGAIDHFSLVLEVADDDMHAHLAASDYKWREAQKVEGRPQQFFVSGPGNEKVEIECVGA